VDKIKAGLQVEVVQGIFGIDIFILRRDISGNVTHVAKPVKFVMDPMEEFGGAIAEPTIHLHPSESHIFLKSFAEALVKNGIKTESDYKIQGILQAQTYHLNDLRKLLKLDK
jgi:hypothetical protein